MRDTARLVASHCSLRLEAIAGRQRPQLLHSMQGDIETFPRERLRRAVALREKQT